MTAAARMIGGRWLELASGALRDATRPQIRGTVLFGLGALTFTALINPAPFIQFFRALPGHLFLVGVVLQFQIMAFALLGAILIANRAADAGAPRRTVYVAAALGGCVLGVLAAYNVTTIVSALERVAGTHVFNSDIYFINYLPSDPQVLDIVLICVAALSMSFLATLYPAWRAASTQPAESLRYE